MPRPKGSQNKSTLARREAEREQIKAELLAEQAAANKLAESEPAPPPAAAEVAETIEERETLDLEGPDESSDPTTVESATVVDGVRLEPLSAGSETIDDSPLDLEPPINPRKKVKPPQTEYLVPKPKPRLDIAASRKQESKHAKTQATRKPAAVPVQRPLGGVFRR